MAEAVAQAQPAGLGGWLHGVGAGGWVGGMACIPARHPGAAESGAQRVSERLKAVRQSNRPQHAGPVAQARRHDVGVDGLENGRRLHVVVE